MTSSILFPTNEFAASSKSFEEIEKLLIPSHSYLRIDESIAYVISKGHFLQYPYVYRNFPRSSSLRTTLEFVLKHSINESAENQILIGESLKVALKESKLSEGDLEKLLTNLLECVNNLNSTANQSLLQVIELVIESNPEKMMKIVEEAILELGKISQPIISKVTAGRLISVLSKYVARLKGEMIDILKRILNNTEIEAKKVWITQIFPRLLENLDPEFIELHLQEQIYETVYSDNDEIGVAALQVILKNLTKFSIQEQSSRIMKLFIDSLTSKKERFSTMATAMMGEIYEKLQNIILKNEANCIKFWRSLIELSQSKNQKILNNFIYNLPGILSLTHSSFKVQPICEIYIQLFYDNNANKQVLSSYFHEMVQMFPNKAEHLKQVIYQIFCEFLDDHDYAEESIKTIDGVIANLNKSKSAFINRQPDSDKMSESMPTTIDVFFGRDHAQLFEAQFCNYLLRYFSVLLTTNNGPALYSFYRTIKTCYLNLPVEFVEKQFLPKLYHAIRHKTAYLQLVIEIMVSLLARDICNSNLINNYVSKVNVELTKSMKSFQREAALLFFYDCSYYLSIETFQEFKLGEKYLQLNNDKNFKIKNLFLSKLPRMLYFFTREEKIESSVVISRYLKDPDQELSRLMAKLEFIEKETQKQVILLHSKNLKEIQKNLVNFKRSEAMARRESKDIRKEDFLKKKVETKSKTKILIKELPKKKLLTVRNSSSNCRKPT